MPVATVIFHRTRRFDDGTISDMKLWRVPDPVRGSTHRFKYSLFYGRPGERLIGYDNEAGKGDHRHHGGREEPYSFIGPEQLMIDFLADVQATRGQHDEGDR